MESIKYMTADDIQNALLEIGETGSYKVNGNDLLIQIEENQSFRFCGSVESREQVDEIFETLQ